MLVWAAATLLGSGAPAFASAALIHEYVIGPVAQEAQYTVSPRGGHLATVLPADGKVTVLLDGVAGPAFDAILRVNGSLKLPGPASGAADFQPVIFSEDGGRFAYLGRLGRQIVLMVDGKELLRLPLADHAVWHLTFTGDHGAHVVLFRGDQSPAKLWIDGHQKTPMDTPGMACSRDGTRYVYPATVAGRPTLIVDGTDAGYMAAQPQFTADGSHLISIGTSSRGQSLLVDGQSIYTTRNIQRLYVAPAGKNIVTVGTYYFDPDDPSWPPEARPVVARYAALYPNGDGDFVAFDGQPVMFTRGTGAQIGRVIFSADGRHYAAVCTKGNVQYLLIDGKRSWEFANIDAGSLTFSPDSTRYAYVATRDGQRYAVVDGKFSPVPAGTDLVRFSPDDQHVACGGAEVIVDGKPTGLRGDFMFGPNGRHFLVAGWRISDGKTGLYLDGHLIYDNPDGVIAWAFSADGQHLFWMAKEAVDPSASQYMFVTYVDGLPLELCYDQPDAAPLVKAISQASDIACARVSPVWRLAADGVLVMVGPVGDHVVRGRVPPSRDVTIASLLPPASSAAIGPGNPDNFEILTERLHDELMREDAAAVNKTGPTSPPSQKP